MTNQLLVKTGSAKEWKTVLDAIATVTDEPKLVATPEGITFKGMDPSHVSLIQIDWPSSSFEKYECPQETKLTLRGEDLTKIINRADKDDAVEVSVTEDGELEVKILGAYKKKFNIHLLEDIAGETPIPKLTFNTKVLTAESLFDRVLNDIKTVSDHISIQSVEEGVAFSGKGDAGSGNVLIEKGNADLLELTTNGEAKGLYSIDYLTAITKAAGKNTDVVVLEYSDKLPLRLTFKLGEQGGKIFFYLAPRVES